MSKPVITILSQSQDEASVEIDYLGVKSVTTIQVNQDGSYNWNSNLKDVNSQLLKSADHSGGRPTGR